MKKPFNVLIISIIVLVIVSCESEINNKNSNFSLKFSDGTEITEKDIMFYDSSTYLLFLKHDFTISESMPGFCAIVGNDTVYQGVTHLCFLSSMPFKPIYITDCSSYGNNIIEIGCYSKEDDLRNDPRIIYALAEKGLLRNGLSCCIDSIGVRPFNGSTEVVCRIKVKNHDNRAYYIPDPRKTGDQKFVKYTGGISFHDLNSKVNYFLKWTDSDANWYILTMNDLTLLNGNAEVTFTFSSSDYNEIPAGIYRADFSFCGLQNNESGLDLSQSDGRIWVGRIRASVDSLVVEY